jgi:uncharacterized cupin superfamily protein
MSNPQEQSQSNNKPHALLRTDAIAKLPEQTISHPFNPNSELRGISLSEFVGLQRVGFHLVRIPPGKESFIYHTHQYEEEFVYILSGRGIAEINGEEFEVSSGDFMGFPTPSVAHHLRNPFDEDLTYIMGGERREFEIADFPNLKKRMIRMGKEAKVVDWDAMSDLIPNQS